MNAFSIMATSIFLPLDAALPFATTGRKKHLRRAITYGKSLAPIYVMAAAFWSISTSFQENTPNRCVNFRLKARAKLRGQKITLVVHLVIVLQCQAGRWTVMRHKIAHH
jgi:formate hydrogenlyase subunit 3/multisubunit Na+/H+ antiporter MnhD subunit